jgi:hypothetical protein
MSAQGAPPAAELEARPGQPDRVVERQQDAINGHQGQMGQIVERAHPTDMLPGYPSMQSQLRLAVPVARQ